MPHGLGQNRHVNLVTCDLDAPDVARLSFKRGSEEIESRIAIRILDVIFSLSAILASLPLLILIAVIISISDTRSVLFRHKRIGIDGKYFYCLKFRTMAINSNQILADLLRDDPAARAEWERDRKLRDDPRVTMIGRFLRKSSLDELPQLWNVLVGEMSIVGPRPIVEDEAILYGRYIRHYCSVRPGITGLWQVSGRNDVTYRRRVALDFKYSQNISLRMYAWVIYRTVPAVILSRGVY